MITVRFSTGVSITYNTATTIKRLQDGGMEICRKDEKGQLWLIALIAPRADCVIEHVTPCRMENPVEGKTIESAVKMLAEAEDLRKAPSYWLSRLKKRLEDFDRRTNQWKEKI